MSNLSLSWCEGLSGLILYLTLINKDKYMDLIEQAQKSVSKQQFSMANSYCHGISSLLQTMVYNEVIGVREQLVRRLLTLSFRDDKGNLIFRGDSRKNQIYDFGTGTLGIYYTILNQKFPFTLEK